MSEPVEYQYRTRPDWIAEWNGWNTCSKESAEAYEKNPYLHDWHYEVRALYTSPPAQRKPLTPDLEADTGYSRDERAAFTAGWEAAEAAHNIKGDA